MAEPPDSSCRSGSAQATTQRRPLPEHRAILTAAAPPPAAVLQRMGEDGFEVTHLYGLTEVYGPPWSTRLEGTSGTALGAEAQAHPRRGRAFDYSRDRGAARRNDPRTDAGMCRRRRRNDGREVMFVLSRRMW